MTGLIIGVLAATSVAVAPSAMANVESTSNLFVVDAQRIEVIPGEGSVAKVVVTRPRPTRFTDRPAREAAPIGVKALLREFGWTPATKRLKASTPNASISIAGERSQIVDIKRARITDGELVLRVKGLTGPLNSGKGPGSLFIDNAPTYPQYQTLEIQNLSADVEDAPPLATAAVTLTSATTARIVLDMSAFGDAYVDRTFEITLGTSSSETWTVGDAAFEVLFDTDVTTNSVLVSLSLIVSFEGDPLQGEGSVFFAL
jgi:hypothetical protein